MRTFKPGQKIKDNRGEIFTVHSQQGTTIVVLEINGTIHATKAWAV